VFTTAVSCDKSLPESTSFDGGVYAGRRVFKNSIKNGFSIMRHAIPHTTNAFTQARLIS
jgi:hypothetical protein